MITDADIKKLKVVFATKDDLQKMESGIRHDMATKDDLKRFATKEDLQRFATKEDLKTLDSKVDSGFLEVIKYIGEIKNELMSEIIGFRNEMRDITGNTRSTLDNRESRIARLEYVNK